MKTSRVIALGGGGVSGCEMRCGLAGERAVERAALWTVFALSRGEGGKLAEEKYPTLMDVASKQRDVELICGLDPNEACAFCEGMPDVNRPQPGWCQVMQTSQLASPPVAPPVPPSHIGEGINDMTFVSHMNLMMQIPCDKKSCEEYMRNEVQGIQEMAPAAMFFDDLLLYCGEVARQKMDPSQGDITSKYPSLTYDSVLAAVIFTYELQAVVLGPSDDNEFYRVYNNALRTRNAKTTEALAGYSHYLFQAVEAMPAYEGILWRGIRGADAVGLAEANYRDGVEIYWNAWSSASVDRDVAKAFATQGGVEGLIIRIEVRTCARSIKDLSALPNEEERVIYPNSKFAVTKSKHQADDGIDEIHLLQLEGEFLF